MSKVDLESKVNVLFGEINFLKYLFETVSSVLARNISFLTGHKGYGRLEGEACNPA